MQVGARAGGCASVAAQLAGHILVACCLRHPSTAAALLRPLPCLATLPICPQPTDQRTPWYAEITSQALAAITTDRSAVGGIKGALQFQGWVEVRGAGGRRGGTEWGWSERGRRPDNQSRASNSPACRRCRPAHLPCPPALVLLPLPTTRRAPARCGGRWPRAAAGACCPQTPPTPCSRTLPPGSPTLRPRWPAPLATPCWPPSSLPSPTAPRGEPTSPQHGRRGPAPLNWCGINTSGQPARHFIPAFKPHPSNFSCCFALLP